MVLAMTFFPFWPAPWKNASLFSRTEPVAGSLPVFAVGDAHALKLYPPAFAHEGIHEQKVLAYVGGKLLIATPAVVAGGEVDGGGTSSWSGFPARHSTRSGVHSRLPTASASLLTLVAGSGRCTR